MAAISLPRDKPIRKRRNPGSIFRPASTLILILSPIRRWKVLRGCRSRRSFARSKRRRAAAYRVPAARRDRCRAGNPGAHQLGCRIFCRRGGLAILGLTYCEHAQSWAAAGAEVTIAEDLAALESMDVAIIVNPNNPDGRLVPAADLCALAEALAAHGGLLIVDEAFVDFLNPSASAVPLMPAQGMIVLRSFGKTYGLAGAAARFRHCAQNISRQNCAPRSAPGPSRARPLPSGQRPCWTRPGSRRRGRGSRRKARRSTNLWRRRVLILLAAACSSGSRGTRTRKSGSNGWRKAAFWCGGSRRAPSGFALALLARIWRSRGFTALWDLKDKVRPAGRCPRLNSSNGCGKPLW